MLIPIVHDVIGKSCILFFYLLFFQYATRFIQFSQACGTFTSWPNNINTGAGRRAAACCKCRRIRGVHDLQPPANLETTTWNSLLQQVMNQHNKPLLCTGSWCSKLLWIDTGPLLQHADTLWFRYPCVVLLVQREKKGIFFRWPADEVIQWRTTCQWIAPVALVEAPSVSFNLKPHVQTRVGCWFPMREGKGVLEVGNNKWATRKIWVLGRFATPGFHLIG